MLAGPRRTHAALTILTAALVAATICGSGYALERLVLRTPARSELVAAHAVGAALLWRYVEAEVHIAGEPVLRSACLQGWGPARKGRPGGRGARVAFSDGERLVLGDRRVARVAAGSSASKVPPIAGVELAGCPRALTNHVAAKLVDGSRPRALPATFAGKPAYRIHVRTRRAVLDVYVERSSLLLLGVRVESRGVTGWSRVRPVPLTPERKRAFLAEFNG